MRECLVLLLTTVLWASVSSAAQSRPHIVWINAEDMSPHLGCYGHPDAITPRIDHVASTGVVYRNAFATAPICSPSRSCLATGLYATALGTQHLRCEVKIPERVVPLGVRLKEQGYFCTNTGKSDYNFDPKGIWDGWTRSPTPWRDRPAGQPFFSFITVGETHEGRINTLSKYEEATKDLPEEMRHDPLDVTIPPFYPDTPEIRRIFAGMHDLASVFDQQVGRLLDDLSADGLLDDTFVFIFGDHGNGLPRYKRWLNDSGLRVPLVIHVPKNFAHLCPHQPGSQTDELVSFVDFPATALSLAGLDVPEILQGRAFLGEEIASPRQFVYGARSRADDMFEVSRSISDGRYFYVRHYMPHLPYIQDSVIFGDRKSSMRELRRLQNAGELEGPPTRFWADRKPLEELYDLREDPHEINNLADNPEYTATKTKLHSELRRWILEHRDSGFLPEAEYQLRALQSRSTPFDVVQSRDLFDLNATLAAAELVGDARVDPDDLAGGLDHVEAGVRYWSAVALGARDEIDERVRVHLFDSIQDNSPAVQIAAAEAIADDPGSTEDQRFAALKRLGVLANDSQPWIALQAARSLANLGETSQPVTELMKSAVDKLRSKPGSSRPYKDFNYSSFTGWALETALGRCGEQTFVDEINESTNP